MANLVIIPEPDDFSPQLVMVGGNIVYKDGERTAAPREVDVPDSMFHTIHLSGQQFPTPPRKGTVRVMELVSRLVTHERLVDLEDPEESSDVIMCLAQDRMGGGEAFTGLLKGFQLKRGACGTTMSWDSGDMIVVGCDPQSMKTVSERLRVLGGGAVFAIGEQVVSEFPAPICGVFSRSPTEQVAEEVGGLQRSLRDHGVPWEKPLLTLDTLSTAAIPHIRITHNGYVKFKERRILPVEVETNP